MSDRPAASPPPSVPPDAVRSALPPRRVAVAAFGAGVLCLVYQQVLENLFVPLQAEIAASVGLDDLRSGLASAAFLVGFAVSQIPAGIAVDRVGPARTTPLVILLAGGSMVLMSTSEGLLGLMASRFVLGALASFATPVVASVARRGFPVALFAVLIGIGDAGVGLGGFGGVAGGNELESALGWRGALRWTGLAGVVVAALAFLALPARWFGPPASPPEAPPPASPWSQLREAWQRREVRIAAAIYAAGCSTMIGFGGMWNLRLAEEWRWGEGEAALISAVFFLGMIVGSPTAGWLASRVGSRRTLLGNLGVGLPVMSYWIFVPNDFPLWADALNVAVVGFCIASVCLAFEVGGRGLPPDRIGGAIALVNLAGIATGSVLEFMPGAISQWSGSIPLRSMQLATSIFAVSMLLTLLAARRVPPGT